MFIIHQEFIVKKGDRVELMAMLGIFGAVISAIQMYPWPFFECMIYSRMSMAIIHPHFRKFN